IYIDVVLLSPEAPLTSETVKFLLQSNKKKYTIIKNESSASSVDWWKPFGYPSKLNENGEYDRIKGFISCFKRFNTFIYNSSSGTSRIKQHANICFGTLSNSSSSIDSSTFTQDDIGFRNIAQELIRIGIFPFGLTNKRFYRLSGHKHGVVAVADIIRGRLQYQEQFMI
ncbi:unnamed protein product, partial [Adineta steineri]